MKKVSTIILALLILGVAITGMYNFIGAVSSSEGGYDVEVDKDKYMIAFDKIENISNKINETYSDIQKLTANTRSTIGIVTLVPKVLILIKNILTLPFILIGGIIFSIQEYVGLPAWASLFLLTLFIIYLVFAFIDLVTGRES